MKVLITGARGFLGGAVRSALSRAGHDVIAISRSAQEGFVSADLGKPETVIALLDGMRPDAVVNCAARVDFGTGVLPGLFPVNVLLPAMIAHWCRARDAYLIQASTIAVHGVRIAEAGPAAPVEPDTDYGRSKWLAEQNIAQAGCRAAVLRFGGLFGRSGPEHLGLNRALRGAMAGTPPTIVGNGRAKRNYVFVQDAAAVIAHGLRSQPQGVRWVGGSEILTTRQMLQTLCDVYLQDARPDTAPGPDSSDQIVRHSADLPVGRSFREALNYERAQ